MRFTKFSFKSEAIWIMILNLALPLIGVLAYLIAWLLR